jgi:hypothetical protein
MAEEKKTPEQIICGIAGIDAIDDVPNATEFVWGGKITFKINDPVPLEGLSDFNVFAMFQEDTEVRVYATPAAPKAEGDLVPLPRRITLNKSNSSRFVEALRFDVFFQQALPNEFRWQYEALIDEPEEGFTEDAIAAVLKKTGAKDVYINRVLELLNADDEEEAAPTPPK